MQLLLPLVKISCTDYWRGSTRLEEPCRAGVPEVGGGMFSCDLGAGWSMTVFGDVRIAPFVERVEDAVGPRLRRTGTVFVEVSILRTICSILTTRSSSLFKMTSWQERQNSSSRNRVAKDDEALKVRGSVGADLSSDDKVTDEPFVSSELCDMLSADIRWIINCKAPASSCETRRHFKNYGRSKKDKNPWVILVHGFRFLVSLF